MKLATLGIRAILAGILLLFGTESRGDKGDAIFTIGVQTLRVDGYVVDSSTDIEFGDLWTNSMFLGLDYYVTDELSVSVTVPYVWVKFEGVAADFAHHPSILDDPFNQTPFLDDGDYHGSWQDASMGLRYESSVGQYALSPFVNFHAPMRDYSHFAFSAVGYNQWRFELGLESGKRFEYTNFYWTGSYGYNFQEEVLGVNTNHHRAYLELGYFATPRLTANMFVVGKYGKGLGAEDFTVFTDERWFLHDQIIRHNWLHVGAGLNIGINGDYSVNLGATTQVWGEEVTDLTYGLTMDIVRAFR